MQSLVALIEGSENDTASLRAAAAMAKAIGGKLTAVHFKTAEMLPIGTFEMVVVPNNLASQQESLQRRQRARSRPKVGGESQPWLRQYAVWWRRSRKTAQTVKSRILTSKASDQRSM